MTKQPPEAGKPKLFASVPRIGRWLYKYYNERNVWQWQDLEKEGSRTRLDYSGMWISDKQVQSGEQQVLLI